MKFSGALQFVSDHNQPLAPSNRAQSPPFILVDSGPLAGTLQNDTVRSSPFSHFQLFLSWASLTAPIQYWLCESLLKRTFFYLEYNQNWNWNVYFKLLKKSYLCLLHNSQLTNPCNAGLLSSTNVPPRDLQKLNESLKFIGWRL